MNETEKTETTKTETTNARKPFLWEALLSFGVLIAILAISIVIFDVSIHLPMILGVAFTGLMALRMGYKYKDIERSMFKGVMLAMQAILILIVVGALIGVWILAGVVPTMIYYGLAILNPQFFLVTALLICSITSLSTGTSWGTAGTVGVAFMGIAAGLGIPLPIAAGAVISGAYFGDKISPLSDTTNLAAAIAGTDVITHIKWMIRQTAVAFVIAIAFFTIMGFVHGTNVDTQGAYYLRQGLAQNFNINPLLFLPPVAVILAIALKVPALPGIFIGVLLGGIMGIIFQQSTDFGAVMQAGYSGFTADTGNEQLDTLLTRGGMARMFYSISLTIIAMCFGGIMEMTKQLEVVVEKMMQLFVRGKTSLAATAVASTVLSNATMPEQYISIILPNRMFSKAYKDRGYHPKMLASAVDGTGTLTSALIPWNTCGIFMLSILGVSALQYAPYAIFNWSVPLIVIALTAMGKLTCKIEDDPTTILATEEF